MIKRRNFHEGFGIEDAPGLYRRIYNIIRGNHINAEIIDTDDNDDYGFAKISIDGDWKHDHLRLKYLLEQAFDTVIWREINTYPSDSDSYEAEYQVYLADPKDNAFTESAIRKSVKGRRYERYNRNSKNRKMTEKYNYTADENIRYLEKYRKYVDQSKGLLNEIDRNWDRLKRVAKDNGDNQYYGEEVALCYTELYDAFQKLNRCYYRMQDLFDGGSPLDDNSNLTLYGG